MDYDPRKSNRVMLFSVLGILIAIAILAPSLLKADSLVCRDNGYIFVYHETSKENRTHNMTFEIPNVRYLPVYNVKMVDNFAKVWLTSAIGGPKFYIRYTPCTLITEDEDDTKVLIFYLEHTNPPILESMRKTLDTGND